MQGQRGFLAAQIDGKTHEFIVSTQDNVWKKRRRILSPAFSAHKMKLVIKVKHLSQFLINTMPYILGVFVQIPYLGNDAGTTHWCKSSYVMIHGG